MSQWDAWIGRSTTAHDVLTPGLVARWHATLDSAATRQGLHWCLCPPDAPTARLGADGHPARNDAPDAFLPPIPLPRRMWAGSELEFEADIPDGATVTRISTIASISEKSGASGTLAFVALDHCVTADGVPAVRERQTLVYRAADAASAPAPVDAAQWPVDEGRTCTPPLLFRYSALTFNTHRIHYDRPYAVDVEGYDGLVVHGPLNATLLLDLAARHGGPVRRFAFRGVSPAIAGEPLRYVADGDRLAVLASGGRVVMRAEVTR